MAERPTGPAPPEAGASRDEGLAVLRQISSLLQASLSGVDSLQPLFQLLRRIVPYESATLFQNDAGRHRLVCRDRVGEAEVNPIDVIRFEMGFGLSAWIAQQRRPIVIPSLRRRSGLDQHDLRSYIGLPLVAGDELVGVLSFGHSRADAFARVESGVLEILGTQIALLLKNLDLVAALHLSNQELSDRNARLREMQARLVESERVKAIADLVAAMNHEINNPLTIISGQAELLALHLEGRDGQAIDKLEIIQQQVRRLGRVLSLLSGLRRAVASSYPGGGQMLDLESSAEPSMKSVPSAT
ncbi:MAG: GAF domain-containing protein [bacterium]|jgi:GAF domain-containing protein|nr:GAF domain-containing protein [bacterium]